jgi:FkbM family methyltransferase
VTYAPNIIQDSNGIWHLKGEQLWDTTILPVCLEHIKEGDTVIDAGAWIGGHAMAYSEKVGEYGMVHAFEPNERAFECLVRNLEKTKQAYPCFNALGDEDKMVAISSKTGWQDSGFVGDGNEVRMVQLDNFKLSPNFIKIDVEGCELKVLKGASKTIEKYRPIIVLEINREALERQGTTPHQVLEWFDGGIYDLQEIGDCTNPDIYNMMSVPR